MMNNKTPEERLQIIIAGQMGCGYDQIIPSARFREDLGCDSIDMIEIVMACEQEFDIDIPDEDLNWFTVGDALTFIKERVTA